MSLINDALKKAQKQRTGDSSPFANTPGVGGESAARIASRAKPVGFNSLLTRLGVGAGIVLVLAVGGYFVMRAPRPQTSPAQAQEPATSSPAPVVTPPQASAATSGQPPAINSQRPASGGFVLPVVTPPPPAPEPVVVRKPEPPVTKPTPATTPSVTASRPQPAAVEPVKPAPLPVKLEPRAITYIENLRIAGIRASATDSKVLMNDRVYRVGDTVEHEMGLKLTGITANSLAFEDERGGRYTRQF